jgi:hypothetical protein
VICGPQSQRSTGTDLDAWKLLKDDWPRKRLEKLLGFFFSGNFSVDQVVCQVMQIHVQAVPDPLGSDSTARFAELTKGW